MNYLDEMGIQQWRRRSLKASVVRVQQTQSTVQETSHQPSERAELGQPLPIVETQLAAIPAVDTAPPAELEKPAGLDKPDSWNQIIADMQGSTACQECLESTPILGEGDQNAEWLVIADAPTRNDIQAQQLLSGRSGQLFDAILDALGLDRQLIYLTSVFKCAPSENVALTPSCSHITTRQLALVQPKKVIALGEFAAQTLLRSNDELAVLRQSLHEPRGLDCQVTATYSITEMLSEPILKARVWQDISRLAV